MQHNKTIKPQSADIKLVLNEKIDLQIITYKQAKPKNMLQNYK